VQFGVALDHGLTPDRLGDGVCESIAEYWEQLFDPATGWWKEELEDKFCVDHHDLLILHCVEICPQSRGRGLGLAVVYRTIDVLGWYCGLIACKPWPLQFTPAFATNRRKLQRLQPPAVQQNEAVRKLKLYRSRAGFRPFGEQDLFVLNPLLKRPKGGEIIPAITLVR
jgi:hypothetical protein